MTSHTKSSKKKIVLGVTLGAALLATAFVIPSVKDNVSADPAKSVSKLSKAEQKKAEAQKEELSTRLTDINLYSEVFDQIDTALEKKEKLSQKKLDDYTYYMIQYWQNGRTYVTSEVEEGGLSTPDEGFTRLEELYKIAGIEPSFKLEGDEVVVTRNIKEPEQHDEVRSDVETQVEKYVESATKEGIGEGKNQENLKIKADVEVSDELTSK